MQKKHLEPQKTYTMISQEHLSSFERRKREEEALKLEKIQVQEDYEPVSPPDGFIPKEIVPQPLRENKIGRGKTQSYMRREEE